MAQTVSLQQGMWFDETEIQLSFPDDWSVHLCDCPADSMTAMTREAVEAAFEKPIGTQKLREMALGKKEVGILFDDISRGTRLYEIVPYVLDELKQAGIKNEQIRFICSLGNHGAHTRIDFVKKLGIEAVENYPVFNHNPYENCTHLGTTSRNTEVHVNSELMKCDLKIGLGCIVPHPFNGYGGGGKILFPGVTSSDTILGNHIVTGADLLGKGLNPVDGLGRFEENVMREEMEEVCKMAGMDMVIDALVNARCDTVDLVVGHPIKAHYEGVDRAKEIYATEEMPGADVVVANANFKASEAAIAALFGMKTLKAGGDLVVATHTPMGQITHYLIGGFGKFIGGKLWSADRGSMLKDVGRLILYTPYRSKADEDWFGGFGRPIWAKTWQEVSELLAQNNHSGTKVNVFTDATIQYFRS